MSITSHRQPYRVALLGNPNCGKTALFNRLTGMQQKIANFPGVTVEKKEGPLQGSSPAIQLIDLPGLYSLQAQSPDEKVAAQFLNSSDGPDVILLVMDCTHLERNFFLLHQVLELKRPLVICLNMTDLAQRQGLTIDHAKLAQQLQGPIVFTTATSGAGIDQLKQILMEQCQLNRPSHVVNLAADDANQIAKRHAWAKALYNESVHSALTGRSTSDQLDRYILHPWLGPLLFVVIMVLIFQGVFYGAAPFMQWIEAGLNGCSQWLLNHIPASLGRDLLVEGVLGGVGAVIIFIPQILILFTFITLLEDSGYLARAAFLVDRLMVRSGLSGKSFIPLLSSFACAIPGIMAARTIKSDRDRLITIMVAPLMTCSARLPVYTMLIAAFIPSATLLGMPLQGWVLFALYMLGIVGAVVVAKLLRHTLLRGKPNFMVMELPDYQWPNWRNLRLCLWVRLKLFLNRAGTTILALSMLLWLLSSFPRQTHTTDGASLEQSYLGQLGHKLAPLVKPLGYDWKIGVGLLASFAAREVFVATMGTLYKVDQADENSHTLRNAMLSDVHPDTGKPLFSIAAVCGLLVFFAFAMQCISTVAVMRRETGGWRWPIYALIYTYTLAYVGAYLTYRVVGYLENVNFI